MKAKILLGLLALSAALAAGAAAFVWSGLYDISATDQHSSRLKQNTSAGV